MRKAPIEKNLGVEPFIGAVKKSKQKSVAIARDGACIGVARRHRPACLRRPHAGINSKKPVVIAEIMRPGRRRDDVFLGAHDRGHLGIF